MNRRNFLQWIGVGAAGLVIPNARVWSFPKEIKVFNSIEPPVYFCRSMGPALTWPVVDNITEIITRNSDGTYTRTLKVGDKILSVEPNSPVAFIRVAQDSRFWEQER